MIWSVKNVEVYVQKDKMDYVKIVSQKKMKNIVENVVNNQKDFQHTIFVWDVHID